MKKGNRYNKFLLGAGLLFCLSGCNSFLDIQPKGTVEQKTQFEDIQGYRDAMYGIYASMAKTSLYGKELSYGFTDQLGQLFYDKYASMPEVVAANAFKYNDQALSSLIETIWTQAYQTISYVNNVLENIEKEDLNRDPDYSLVRGEAYALRAFLHFDMMRLFCDNFRLHPEAGGIPYSYTFDLKNKRVYTLKECYDNVLEDLTHAEAYLRTDEKMVDSEANSVYRSTRRSHCNKYAVWALKARVFHYKGDLDSAAYYAGKVVDSPWLQLTDAKKYVDVKRYGRDNPEMIWGLYTDQLYSTYYDLFLQGDLGVGNVLWVKAGVRSIYDIGNSGADSWDYRGNAFFTETTETGLSQEYFFTRLLGKTEQAYYLTGVCLLRLPEMYYILAEASYPQDPAKALSYLNDVRNSRGLKNLDAAQVPDAGKFAEALVAERCKEFWGEGQIFFTYKRNHIAFRNAWDNADIQPSTDIFVLPWPQSEREYGGTNQ